MKTKNVDKQVEELSALNYTIVLRQDDEGDVVASIKELEGCVAHGQDAMEALASLESMKRLWIESCLRDGQLVPLPSKEDDLPSGKWLQRAPKTLHLKLIQAATEDGVSLNGFVCTSLAEAIGRRVRLSTSAGAGILNTLVGSAEFRNVEPYRKWMMHTSVSDNDHFYASAMIEAIAPSGPRISGRRKHEDQPPSRSFAYQA